MVGLEANEPGSSSEGRTQSGEKGLDVNNHDALRKAEPTSPAQYDIVGFGQNGSYNQQYHSQYIRALDQGEQADRAQLGKAYQTAGVLYEVHCAVNKSEGVQEVAPEIIAAARHFEEMQNIYARYNILPLDAAGASQAVMHSKS